MSLEVPEVPSQAVWGPPFHSSLLSSAWSTLIFLFSWVSLWSSSQTVEYCVVGSCFSSAGRHYTAAASASAPVGNSQSLFPSGWEHDSGVSEPAALARAGGINFTGWGWHSLLRSTRASLLTACCKERCCPRFAHLPGAAAQAAKSCQGQDGERAPGLCPVLLGWAAGVRRGLWRSEELGWDTRLGHVILNVNLIILNVKLQQGSAPEGR